MLRRALHAAAQPRLGQELSIGLERSKLFNDNSEPSSFAFVCPSDQLSLLRPHEQRWSRGFESGLGGRKKQSSSATGALKKGRGLPEKQKSNDFSHFFRVRLRRAPPKKVAAPGKSKKAKLGSVSGI